MNKGTSIQIPDVGLEAIGYLIDFGPARIERLVEVSRRQELSADALAIARSLSKALDVPFEKMSTVLQAVLGMNELRYDLNLNPNDFVDLLTAALEAQSDGWIKQHSAGWHAIAPNLPGLFEVRYCQ